MVRGWGGVFLNTRQNMVFKRFVETLELLETSLSICSDFPGV